MALKLTCYSCGKKKPIDQYRIVTKVREPGYHKGERVRECMDCERPRIKVDDVLTRVWA